MLCCVAKKYNELFPKQKKDKSKEDKKPKQEQKQQPKKESKKKPEPEPEEEEEAPKPAPKFVDPYADMPKRLILTKVFCLIDIIFCMSP